MIRDSYNLYFNIFLDSAPELQLPDIEEALKEIIEPYRLGMYLGIKEENLKIIEANYPKRERQKNEIISYWKRNFNDCSWKALAKAVEKMGGHANLVKELMARGDQELNDTSQISEQGIYHLPFILQLQ